MENIKIDIIVPVYKNKDLTELCLNSVAQNLEEIKENSPRVIIINDSPDHTEVSKFLIDFTKYHKFAKLIINEKNLGFVKSVNKGLALSRAAGRAAILVNSDTITFPGTLVKLIEAAASDPQIGFACPRSNNASLSTLPKLPHNLAGASITPEQTYKNWKAISDLLPAVSYAPTAVGFYLYINPDVVANFGKLNEDFELGYEEENDLVMRANKVGYRAVLANHSFAFHSGSASFLLQDFDLDSHKNKNLQKINAIHPEFLRLVRNYERSPEFIAENLLKNLIPSKQGKFRIAIDLSRLGLHTNGTSELVIAVVTEIANNFAHKYDLTVICSKAAFKFHGLDKLPNIECTESITGNYAIAINLGQPFDLHQINVLETLAPINIYGMLDVIAEDCGYVSIQFDIDRFWRYATNHSNGLFFISKFSELTYFNRHPLEHNKKAYTKLLSTKVSEYSKRYKDISRGERHILVLGNHFAHKDSDITAKRIAEQLTNCNVVVLGSDNFTSGNLKGYRSGTVADEIMNDLVAKASVVVLPSYYEGFGFGFMHALALNKPIVARDIPATREILESFSSVEGVALYKNNDDVTDLIAEMVTVGFSKVDDTHAGDWKKWTSGFMSFCDELIQSKDIYARTVERLHAGNNLREFFQLRDMLNSAQSGQSTLPIAVNIPSQQVTQVSPVQQAAPSKSDEKSIKTVDDLMSLNDGDFVKTAYQKILLRECDNEGFLFYLNKIKNGHSKIEIIRDMKNSPEGKSANSKFTGLENGKFNSRSLNFFDKIFKS